jgi:cytochrome d ubiquinol oxidase subunit II
VTSSALQVGVLGFIGLGVTLYLVLGGADFGGGMWDLLAFGPSRDRQRVLVADAIGPVWEVNHVWLIFILAGLLAAFPQAMAAIGVGLYLPLLLAGVGIIFRGSGFAFSHAGPGSWQRAWARTFGIASLVTPFFLGAAGAAIATGRIRVRDGQVHAGVVSAWTSPLSIVAGLLVVAMCSYLAASYLIVEAAQRGDHDLAEAFRARAIVTAVVAGALAALGLVAIHAKAPLLWHGMLHRGFPAIGLSGAAGLGSLVALWGRRYLVARATAALAVAAVVLGFGASLWPYLVIPDVSVRGAASPASTLRAVFFGYVVGGLVLGPAFWLLFRVFKSGRAQPTPFGPVP